jgi:hypothetical protein
VIKLKDILFEGKAKTGDYVKTIFGVAQIEKVRGTIAYMKLPGKKTKGYWMNDLKHLKPTGKKERGKDLWTEGLLNETRFRVRGYKDEKEVIKLAKKNNWKFKKTPFPPQDVRFDIQGDDRQIMTAIAKHGIIISHLDEGFSKNMIIYAIGLADKYAGNMTKAVKLIDKIKKGLSDDPKVKAALQAANESINELSASVIRNKLLKQFGDDPLYKDFIIAKTSKEQKKALATLKSIRGGNAIVLMQKYVKKLQGESVNERIERNEVHAETKKELKAAIARSMKEILNGKTPKYDIINGRTGEMIGWKDGNDYIWQPNAIPYAERELK